MSLFVSENLINMDKYQRTQGGIVRIDSRCHPIFNGVNTVGRNKNAVVNVKNLNVSQNQALLILVDDTQHFLVDMNSSNGTFLDNTKLIPFKLYKLTNDVQLKFGDVQATYLKLTVCNNTSLVRETQLLETTQNMTQNFYASNTQLMDDMDDAELNCNNERHKSKVTPNIDIHDIATQEVHFPSQLFTNISECSRKNLDTPITQAISEEEIINNIHDAPTQVVTFQPSDDPPHQNEIIGDSNIHNAPTQAMSLDKSNSPTPNEVVEKSQEQKENIITQVPMSGNNVNNIKTSEDRSSTQGSSDTVILNSMEMADISSKIIGSSTRLSYLGPSSSKIDRTIDDSLLNNSKDIDSAQETEIEETVIEENLTKSLEEENSNDSVDLLAGHYVGEINEENKENIETIFQKNSQPKDVGTNLEEKLGNIHKSKGDDSDCDTDIESNRKSSRDSSQNSSITNKKKVVKKIQSSPDESDSDEEVIQNSIKPKKHTLQKLSSDSESEMEVGTLKKRVKKLESDSESLILNENSINSDSETDCEDELAKQKLSKNANGTEETESLNLACNKQKETHIVLDTKTSDMKLNLQESSKQQMKKTFSSDSETDCEDDIEKVFQEKNDNDASPSKRSSINNEEDTLNDTDCIPATQDAFAEAFSYKIESGKSSSTEDFRLGLTQLMEDSLNDEVSKLSQQNKCGGSQRIVNAGQDKGSKPDNFNQNIENPDDVYCMPTQKICELKTPQSSSILENVGEDDEYLLPTQKIAQKTNVLTSQKLSERTQTENDDDIYMLATQPVNTESQFKVPKSFTFKKKPVAILEESLSSLLGDKIQDDDVYDVATQKITDSDKIYKIHNDDEDDDTFDVPTQKLSDIFESKEAEKEEEAEIGIYSQPTQCLNPRMENVQPSTSSESKKEEKIEMRQPQIPIKTLDAQQAFDMPTQLIGIESLDSGSTQEELELCNANDSSIPDHIRPNNPVANVLDEDNVPKETPVRRSRRKSPSPLLEPPQNKKQKNVADSKKMSKIVEEAPAETVSQIEAFVKVSSGEISSKTSEVLGDTSLTTKNKSRKDDAIETLSQIEAFIREPLPRTQSRTRASKPSSSTENEERSVPHSSGSDNSKKSLKRRISTHDETEPAAKKLEPIPERNNLVNSDEYEKLDSTTASDSEENHSRRDQDVVKSDIDQSFALLESKATKARKRQTDSVLHNIKVTVASNRRSMDIAAISDVVSTRARRTTTGINSTRGKRTIKEDEKHKENSDSSDTDIPKTKSTRQKSKKESVDSKNPKDKLRRGTSISKNEGNSVDQIKSKDSRTRRNADSEFSETDIPKKSTRQKLPKGVSDSENHKSNDSHQSTKYEDIIEASDQSKVATKSSVSGTAKKVAVPKPGSTRKLTSKGSSEKSEGNVDRVDENSLATTKEVIMKEVTVRIKSEKDLASGNDGETKQIIEQQTPVKRRRTAFKSKIGSTSDEGVNSESSTSTDVSTTPKKQSIVTNELLLNSADRAKRKLKPKVVFTMLDSPQLQSLIRQLGGSIVDTVNACTVLVTESVKRSQKLLTAVGQGKPICSPQWIKESKQKGEFLDPWDFILIDKEAEKKWNFSLKESLTRSTNNNLLSGYFFQIMATNGADVLKGAIEACGGKCISKLPSKGTEGSFVVVATPDQKSKYTKISKQNSNSKVVEPEAIFDGVLRQELRFSKHLLT